MRNYLCCDVPHKHVFVVYTYRKRHTCIHHVRTPVSYECMYSNFFFVTGTLLCRQPQLSLQKQLHKTLHALTLLCVWGVITLSIVYTYRSMPWDMSSLIHDLFSLKHGIIHHLWFLKTFAFILLISPIIHLVYTKQRSVYLLLTLLTCIVAFGQSTLHMMHTIYTIYTETTLPPFQTINYLGSYNPFGNLKTWALAYVLLGGVYYTERDRILQYVTRQKAWVLLGIGTAFLSAYGIYISRSTGTLWDSVWYGYDAPFTIIITGALVLLAERYLSTRDIPTLRWIGTQTLGIYLIHMILVYTTRNELASYLDHTYTRILYTILILASSLLCTYILDKIPYMRKLVRI